MTEESAPGASSGLPDMLDRARFPVDEWALVEREFDPENQGHAETVFTVGNGYLGLRGNIDEGREGHLHGTFVNGFHETWPIRHAEEAFGFARVGQTIVNAPDAKTMRLYVDDEPFVLATADLEEYERRLDFRSGVLERRLIWRTPAGKRVRIVSRRMASFSDRHLAIVEYEAECLDSDASIVISSQILNRQDGAHEYSRRAPRRMRDASESFDPRQAEQLAGRILQPKLQRVEEGRYALGYETVNSGMTIVVAVEHRIETDCPVEQLERIGEDLAKHVFTVHARRGRPVRVVKYIAYGTAAEVPVPELADRCDRILDRAAGTPLAEHYARQRAWLDRFWEASDVWVEGCPQMQQAIRWNLFSVAQASARTDGGGIAAKGVTGSGYGGHYFWDTEIFVMPFLTYTAPQVARNALRFRVQLLDAARRRARELNQQGALFPWRTINGEESSAYYAASTAQYHIDADIVHALMQYVMATGDEDFLLAGGVEVLVETARMWADLGFWRSGEEGARFHIHGVTGPDEYTTVVNDNLFTNVMAKENLEVAARTVRWFHVHQPEVYERFARRLGLSESEVHEWQQAAERMYVPYDERARVHPQDEAFLDKEVWDLENTPQDKRPLLLHFHPLVIYRFQVIKQADVVLALFLRGDLFTADEKRRDFEYYDALTTGDSSLSAVVQSIIAAEVGYVELAMRYFLQGLFVDLADLHANTADGVHIASTGGVWAALVNGFGGMRDHGGHLSFEPRLPAEWSSLSFRLRWHGTAFNVRLTREAIAFDIVEGEAVTVRVRGEHVELVPGVPTVVPLPDQGPVIPGEGPGKSGVTGKTRADGTPVTASIPVVSHFFEI
ncbi:MAG: glycosyl hydrolase family 65 protein [Pseudoclavibacter sp.]|nr:glycosyl hydrolase family 65 protein [Pseudoclavibacter sp.]